MMPEPSYYQQLFLRRIKREKQLIVLWRTAVFLLFLLIWECSARYGLIDSFIFSSPSLIWKSFMEMCRDLSIFSHLGVTVTETLVSFFIVVILGAGLAVLLWCFPRLAQVTEPYLVILNSLYAGFQNTDPDKLKLIETLGGGKKEKFQKIILPSSLPLFLSVMKVNIGLCLVGVIIGEFIGARQGLGYLIIYSSQTFKLTWVLMSITLLCIIALILYGLLGLIEKYVTK